MDPWKLLGTIAGCIAADIGFRLIIEFAKEQGRQEAYQEIEQNQEPYIKSGKKGEPIVIVFQGKEYWIRLEPKEE